MYVHWYIGIMCNIPQQAPLPTAQCCAYYVEKIEEPGDEARFMYMYVPYFYIATCTCITTINCAVLPTHKHCGVSKALGATDS